MEEHVARLTLAHRGGGAGGIAALRASTAHCQPPLRIRCRDPSSATAVSPTPSASSIPAFPSLPILVAHPKRHSPAMRPAHITTAAATAIATDVAVAQRWALGVREEDTPDTREPARRRADQCGSGGGGVTNSTAGRRVQPR